MLKVSPVTVRRNWSSAKIWLYGGPAVPPTMDLDHWKQLDNLLRSVLSDRPRSATSFSGTRARATSHWSAGSAFS